MDEDFQTETSRERVPGLFRSQIMLELQKGALGVALRRAGGSQGVPERSPEV